jgi:hypothetical protein
MRAKDSYQFFGVITHNIRSIRREIMAKERVGEVEHQYQNKGIQNLTENKSSEVSRSVITNSFKIFYIL